jgi:transcriptional regulator with XRE-family HTH domain
MKARKKRKPPTYATAPSTEPEAECFKLADAFKRRRKNKNLDVKTVAKRAKLTPQCVRLIERRKRVPGLSSALRMSHALHASLWRLLRPIEQQMRG